MGLEPITPALKVRCATIAPLAHFMAGEEGFEPSSTSVLETGVFPLNYSPIYYLACGINSARHRVCIVPLNPLFIRFILGI